MPYLRFALYAPLHVGMILLSYALSLPLAALSVAMGRDTLPGFLSWFHTHDDTLDGGQRQLGWKRRSGLRLALQRALWICRNPAYGFRARVLGFPAEGTEREMLSYVGDTSDPKSGYVQRYVLRRGGRWYFGYRTLRVWLGWRWDESGGYHIYKLSLRPFHRD